jgi:hypothetical protein
MAVASQLSWQTFGIVLEAPVSRTTMSCDHPKGRRAAGKIVAGKNSWMYSDETIDGVQKGEAAQKQTNDIKGRRQIHLRTAKYDEKHPGNNNTSQQQKKAKENCDNHQTLNTTFPPQRSKCID